MRIALAAIVLLLVLVGTAGAGKPVKPPKAPTGLVISNITQTGGTLTWNKVNGAVGYDIYVDGKLVGKTGP
jgi:hypothetical protein